MTKKGHYTPTPRKPTDQDRQFIKDVAAGKMRTRAFREAYPDHPKVSRYMDIVSKRAEPEDENERTRLADSIKALAKDKVQAKYIQAHLQNFNDAMETLASKSIIVASDLLDNSRSDMVKADLAKEFIRHKVGTPTVKVQAQVDKTVHLEFGTPAGRDDMDDIVEGEVVE